MTEFHIGFVDDECTVLRREIVPKIDPASFELNQGSRDRLSAPLARRKRRVPDETTSVNGPAGTVTGALHGPAKACTAASCQRGTALERQRSSTWITAGAAPAASGTSTAAASNDHTTGARSLIAPTPAQGPGPGRGRNTPASR